GDRLAHVVDVVGADAPRELGVVAVEHVGERAPAAARARVAQQHHVALPGRFHARLPYHARYSGRMALRDELIAMNGASLMRALCEGHPIDPAALDDTEYRGIALGLPRFVEWISWKTFQKTFHRDPATGALRGSHVRVEQRGLD